MTQLQVFLSTESRQNADVLIVPVYEDVGTVTELKKFDTHVAHMLGRLTESRDFVGKKMERMVVPMDADESVYPRVMYVGLGKEKEISVKRLREVIGAAYVHAQNKKWQRIALYVPRGLHKKMKGGELLGSLLARSLVVSTYSYDEYKTDPEAVTVPVNALQVIIAGDTREKKSYEKGLAHGQLIGEAVNHARHLGNTPPTVMTPTYLAQSVKELAQHYPSLKTTILSRPAIEKLGMGGLLGVARGSCEEPKFIIVEYRGASKSVKPSVLVGKGITFDSGGLSLKPGEYMMDMKFDMLGAASVLGAMQGIASLKLKKNVIALIPSAENMPSGTAFRPDDILTAMNGKTIEIQNTDAEGRLILADALCYASRYEPVEVIDLATLTGACMVALGLERSGIFSPDDTLAERLIASASLSGEMLWRMPLGEEYSDAMKSEVADIKNLGGVGGVRYGGASTAAAFLQFFTDYPWAHIDLSSATHMSKSKQWIRHGANGFGVETLIEYFAKTT